MNRAIHRSQVVITRRWRQPLPVVLGVALSLCGAKLPAQQSAPPTDPWRIVAPPQATLVFARDGSLIGEIGREKRISISIKTLPRYVPQAFVAVEDHRFYQHDGVDVVGIAGALKDNILGESRGASTITQQLVGNMHPSVIDRTDKSLSRKLDEQKAAREMERHYTKDQILEAYLNQIGFGRGWYGIEIAARHYFGKSASRLSIAEAAALAAMPKGPALYDPVRNPERVRARRNIVLSLMATQGYITRAQATAAQATPITTAKNFGVAAPSPWFVDVVRVQATRAGIPVANGGYRIHTSLDPLLQNAATAALEEETTALEGEPGYRHPRHASGAGDYLQGMVVVMDPASGDVRALVGGRDYEASQFNRAVDAMRQPGSAFKPIVYAGAVADSIAATTTVFDTALAIPLSNRSTYRPGNSDHQFLGAITLREALAKSRNTVAVQLGLSVGMDSVAALARRMGIASPIALYPSSAIGASAVQPLDLVAAYTTFANLGTPVEPRFIHRIEDRNGRVVLNREVRALTRAMDPGVAFVVREMMRDVVERGTATSIRRHLPATIPVAGKTGTTNDNTDVWFIGMTPELVAGVWLGFDKPKTITTSAGGGSLAAPIWARTIARYYEANPRLTVAKETQWQPPTGVISGEMDRGTGDLATDVTLAEQRYTEYWIEGTEPAELRLDPWKIFSRGALIF